MGKKEFIAGTMDFRVGIFHPQVARGAELKEIKKATATATTASMAGMAGITGKKTKGHSDEHGRFIEKPEDLSLAIGLQTVIYIR